MATRNENIRFNVYLNDKQAGKTTSQLYKQARILRSEINKLEIGSKKWISKMAELKNVNRQLEAVRGELRGGSFYLNKMADGFNKYFGMVTALTATFAGLIMSFRKLIDLADEFEESLDNLSALTGLAGKELDWLGDRAKKFSTTTTEEGIRITKSAKDIVDAYTKMGSARPELLKDKEALANVTEQAIVLAEAGKMKLEPATAALATSMNQFNAEASQAPRYINTMAAGSKVGAGDIPYLTEAVEKMGTSASLMNIEFEESIGVLEAVAPYYKEARMAGNSLDKVLLKLKANQIGYKDGVFDLNRAIDELRVRYQNGQSAADIFGVEHAKMGELLVINQDKFQEYTEAVTGSNVAIEQAITNTDNHKAKLAQARNKFNLMAITLGEKLAPAITISTNGFTYLLKLIVAFPKIIKENQILIIALTGAYLAYNAAKLKGIALSIRDIAVKKAVLLAEKNQLIMVNAQVAAARVRIMLTGKATFAQKRMIVTQMALNKAMLANPLGFVIAGFTALIAAIKMYDKFSPRAIRLQEQKAAAAKKLAEANEALQETYNKIRGEVNNLNRLSVTEKQDLKDKITNTLALAEAELFWLEVKQKQIQEDNTRTSLWQKAKNWVLSAGNTYVKVGLDAMSATKNGQEAADGMNDSLDALREKIIGLKNTQKGLSDIFQAEQIGDSIGSGTLTELEEKLNHYQVALKNTLVGSQDFFRIQSKIKGVEMEIANIRHGGVVSDSENLKALTDMSLRKLALLEKFRRSQLSADEKELQDIRDKYQTELDLATKYLDEKKITKEEFEAQVAELERMKEEELQAKKEEQAAANETKLQEKIYEARKAYQLVADEELKEMELAKLELDFADKLLTVEEYEQAKADIEARYRQMREAKRQESLDKEVEAFEESIEKQRKITGAFSDFFGAMKDMELAAAGENEEKKKQIAKKYAIFELLTQGSSIIGSTSEAVMKAIAAFPLTAGQPFAGIATATGVMQLAKLAIEKSKIAGFAYGGDTGSGPWDEVAGVVHRGEYVIPAWMRELPVVANLEGMLENIRTRGFANGGPVQLPKETATGSAQEAAGGESQTNLMMIALLNKLLTRLDQPIQAQGVWEWEQFKAGYNRMVELEQSGLKG